MKKIYKLATFIFPLVACLNANAQDIDDEEDEEKVIIKIEKTNFFNHNIDYHVRGQLSLGGASPMGIPSEIRKIEGFKPQTVLGIEVGATKWFKDNQKLGIRVGLKFEGKGMRTQALVKNYYTQIADETGAETRGYFTGQVVTDVKNTYLTMPVLLYWNASKSWNFYGGFYFSALMGKSFTGHIYDGAFREGSPIGELTTFEQTAKGLYDFSDEQKGFQWGNQIGAELRISNRFKLSLDLTMANSQLFKKDFEAITFKMYNIFGNLGVVYKL